MRETRLDPDVSVLALSAGDRILGRALSAPLPEGAEGPAAEDLLADAFFSLYAETPLLPEAPEGREVNHALLSWARSLPSWGETEAVRGSIPLAVAAAPAFVASLLREDALREALRRQEEAEQRRRRAEEAEGEALLEEARGNRRRAAALRRRADALREEAARTGREAAEGLRSLPALRHALALAARTAAREARETEGVLRGWGLNPGRLARLPAPEAARLTERFRRHPRAAEVARLAGRLRIAFRAGRRERVGLGPPTRWGLTRDLERTDPGELALLSPHAPPPARALQAARWASEGLPGLLPQGEREAPGPFLAAVDTSGSMTGERETAAKALALALYLIAREEGREAALALFGARGEWLLLEGREAEKNPDALLEWLEAGFREGTDFNTPLARGAEWVGGRTGADLLLISDGIARLGPDGRDALRRLHENGGRLLYIPVDTGTGDLHHAADLILPIPDLTPEDAAHLAHALGKAL